MIVNLAHACLEVYAIFRNQYFLISADVSRLQFSVMTSELLTFKCFKPFFTIKTRVEVTVQVVMFGDRDSKNCNGMLRC